MAPKAGKEEEPSGRWTRAEEEEPPEVVDGSGSDDVPLSGHEIERRRLRQRWELASVLNFLQVFEPVLETDLKLSAEEIENALISPSEELGRIHLALLKGISQIKKNMSESDAWITLVCKELDSWWPWVAEGDIPLKADNGEEIRRYKELDPTIRLQILKALCEVRADQYDIPSYVNDELKAGAKLTTFRKEPMSVESDDHNGVTYWYDGDPVFGHRLYKEVLQSDLKPRATGEEMSLPSFQWEVLATNFEEFQEISKKLSSSTAKGEIAVRKTMDLEIIPVLEKLQKKKERKMKRLQRQEMQLEALQTLCRFGTDRTRRVRKPVCYTFEAYDRSIKEAIHIAMKAKIPGLSNDGSSNADHAARMVKHGSSMDKENIVPGYEFGEDENQIRNANDDESKDNCIIEDNLATRQTRQRLRQHRHDTEQKLVTGVFKSTRGAANINKNNDNECHAGAHANMKKRLRERPLANPTYSLGIVSDPDDSVTLPEKQSRRRQ